MEKYNHKEIEKKWQDKWEESQIYKTAGNPKNKKYILDMFPYPSGAGLHVGHPEGYTATDILSRFSRMNGFDVLHPMGWDAFGLPAENYAIKTGVHPDVSTNENINKFREQIKSIGLSYDWSREVNTSSPEYYKWTQWLFLQLYKAGMAYKKQAYVNWCPQDQTVLANEQVKDGTCDRCGNVVEQKLLSQWFFKITDYADRLLVDMENLDWPEPIKLMQKNWIGKSEGAEIEFEIENFKEKVKVFTTRPDTIFGATYLVLAPEHPLVSELESAIINIDEVKKYIEKTKSKTELQRYSLEKEKTGVQLKGLSVINPATKEKIPVWIADFVLVTYGTGAIMAVPAHDERDFAFAKEFQLPIKRVVIDRWDDAYKNGQISFDPEFQVPPYLAEGWLINSGKYNGLKSDRARSEMAQEFGQPKIQFKLRDWLVSRQRYWGAPIPIIYCDKCGEQPVPENDLPVKLPTDVDFKPTGESPLTRSKEFHSVKCPNCGGAARRDSDTMDTFVDSSWYFIRYTDPNNTEEFANKEEINKWLPVDVYLGGAEHAVMHLLYARFITKFLADQKQINFNEPFIKLRNQGLILGPDGEKMSKSRGNVINPDDVIAEFGADSFRMYEMFMGPLEDVKPCSTQGILGLRRFLDKVERFEADGEAVNNDSIHKLIKKVTDDINSYKFNTAIAAFMSFLNENKSLNKPDWETFLKLLAPFAPHITEEIWHNLGSNNSIHLESWPKHDESKLKEDSVTIPVQVLGKLRGTITVPTDATAEEVKRLVMADEGIAKHLEGKTIVKEIFVPNKLINFVIK